MKTPRSVLATLLVEAGAIALLHFVLMHWMAGGNVVAVIFAASSHCPVPTLAGALLFVVVRLLAVLILPGIILARLGMFAVDRWTQKQDSDRKSS